MQLERAVTAFGCLLSAKAPKTGCEDFETYENPTFNAGGGLRGLRLKTSYAHFVEGAFLELRFVVVVMKPYISLKPLWAFQALRISNLMSLMLTSSLAFSS